MINLSPNRDFCPKKAAVLGSTGSVGTQTIDVIRELGLEVSLLTAGENTSMLAEQIREFSPRLVSVTSEAAAKRLREELSAEYLPEIIVDENELFDAIEKTDADIIFHSVGGLAGLGHALAAARSGKRVGMANKEAIISAGDMIFDIMNQSGGEMIPVDSEHCAVYRCLENRDPADLKKIILTASGGPFYNKTRDDLKNVTAADALAHPTWKMGKKITVDSATLMNKGFEIIEAVRLFGVDESKVDVVIHRQSIIHSMIEYNDNTFMAQMGRPDMRDCIRYAATAPRSAEVSYGELDLVSVASLTFDRPDTNAFTLLDSARHAIRLGGTAPASLIAADEEAVDAFLHDRIGFNDISDIVERTLESVEVIEEISREALEYATLGARMTVGELIKKI
ncbi:MAG: 1-deoxy-D-xylulose-5-phosphate reductoisomerase [Ruminococcaceae bacterium]|nr:1-deoxy-D-xylulose-5-phosphate reductoisomerase [Oscillospiraceae bacterium]